MWVMQIGEDGLPAGKKNIAKPEDGASLPDGVTDIMPPDLEDGYTCRWNGESWTIEICRPQC